MGDDNGDAASKVWVVSDIRDPFFGKPVPEDLLGSDGDPPCLVGEKGIASWDSSSRFCELVSKADPEATISQWKPSSGDSRILPVVTDPAGKRNRTLRDTLSAFTVHTITDWPHQGSRAFSEFVSSVAAAADTWVAYHAEWARTSGVGSGTAPAHEHRILCEYMRLSHSVDQMNCPNLASTELLTRRLIQLEMAVERCPRSPDFSGLACVLVGSTTESVGAIARDFTEWVSNKQRDRAGVLKQQRLMRDESLLEQKRLAEKGRPGGADKGGGKGNEKKGGGGGQAGAATDG